MALVREYAQSNSEQAFATLVSRQVHLVYSIAMRQVRDPNLAEEITQRVFIILARKAKSLSPKTILSGWLCRTARYVSADTLKIQRRRQFREQESQMQSILNESDSTAWNQIAPLLDEALNCLGEKEHDAIVLRFFDGKELKQVGAAMQTTEDAARMRVNRGLEKLREFFTKRGVTPSAAAIAGALSANSVQAAPAALAAAITTAAFSGAIITTAAVIAASKTISMTTLQKSVITAFCTVAAGAGIYEARQAASARAELQTLRQQQATLAEQSQQFQHERDEVLAENAQLKSEPNQTELPRLRGEVTELRGKLNDLPANRVALLKQKLEQMPEKRIPELQFLTEKDWLNAAWDADLDSDDGVRLALRKLRDESVDTFLNQMRQALKAYAAANNGMLPAGLSELKPYFQTPVTEEMLQRYRLLQTGKLSEASSGSLVSKRVYADSEYDSNQEMSLNGGGGGAFNRIQDAINGAAREFARDHNFQAPTNPAQIAPYLKKAIDTATIQKYLNQFVLDPPSPEEVTMAPVLKAYASDHNGEFPKSPSDLLPYITTSEQQAAFHSQVRIPFLAFNYAAAAETHGCWYYSGPSPSPSARNRWSPNPTNEASALRARTPAVRSVDVLVRSGYTEGMRPRKTYGRI